MSDTPTPVDILVVTALAEESAAARDAWDCRDVPFTGGHDPSFRTVRNDAVVVVTTGAGKAAAAAGLGCALQQWRPGLIIAAGIGGGIASPVAPGTFVRATETAVYDEDATALGMPLGTLHRERDPRLRIASPPGIPDPARWITGAIAAGVYEDRSLHEGLVVSGDTLLTPRTVAAQPQERRELIDHALAVDMESAIWARTAAWAGIPLVVLRLISDQVVTGERTGFVRSCEEIGAVVRELVNACRRGPDGAIVSA